MAGSERRRPSWRWRHWPLRRKGLAVVSLPVVALVALSVLGITAQRTHDRLDQAEDRTSRLRTVVFETLIAVALFCGACTPRPEPLEVPELD